MNNQLVPGLEDFCDRYNYKGKLARVIDSRDKEDAKFYYINTEKILNYMRKNYIYLTQKLKSYMIDLKYNMKELDDIINEEMFQ